MARLAEVERRRRRVELAGGLANCVAVWLAALVVVTLVAGRLDLSSRLRSGLLIVMLAVVVASALRWLLLPLARRRRAEEVARWLEQRIGGLDNGLINAIQLSQERGVAEPALLQRAIAEASRAADRVDPARAIGLEGLKRRAGLAGAMLVVVLVYLGSAWPTFARGWATVMQPGRFVPRVGRIKISRVEPGDATVLPGESLTVTVHVQAGPGRLVGAKLFAMHPGGPARQYPMVPADAGYGSYRYRFEAVVSSFEYRIEVGDSQTPIYRVTVPRQDVVAGLDHVYRYPAYLALPVREVRDAAGPVEVPVGTTIQIAVRLRQPLAAGELVLASGQTMAMERRAAGYRFVAELTARQDDSYAVVLRKGDGQSLARLPSLASRSDSGVGEASGRAVRGFWPIRVIPDRRPAVVWLEPGCDVWAAPGQRVVLRVQASDDHRVSAIELYSATDQSSAGLLLDVGRNFDDPTRAELATAIDIEPGRYRAGEVIWYWAVAWDNRDLPGVGGRQASSDQQHPAKRYRIFVQATEQIEQQRLERLEQLRRRLRAILDLQVRLKGQAILSKKLPVGRERRKCLRGIHAGQGQVHEQLGELAEGLAFDAWTLTVQRQLSRLANNEARRAVVAAATLEQAAEAEDIASLAEELVELQGRIVEVLSGLLGMVGARAAGPGEVPSSQRAGDIPVDELPGLEELAEQLQRFVEQQRQVIDATADLAKQPVDDYSQRDLAELGQLAAVEDDWSRFLEQAAGDLSKLPAQDFSSPSLVAELVEIESQIKLASDALRSKSVEIAVALEQAGLELAEELTSHLEKWLPDEPDRYKWSMEEPIESMDAPLAELPDELEDIVGELLEQEEDLFDEIEDVSSSWADSLDKGAGWTAMDGPISNMSAQGVTGNVLPNASEIGGRSGEGRQGRASGEMVEQTATGKGGRRTPTRLTREPFQAGEVRDSSAEPPGGATGGGKLSGAGSEGLEGPVPPELARQLGRLAGRQAALRNVAEKIDPQLKVRNYWAFRQMQGVIRLMRRTERDLAGLAYRNALRRRAVLIGSLQAVRSELGGGQVRRDGSVAGPERAMSNIQDVSERDFPAAYRDLLKRYYEALSTGQIR